MLCCETLPATNLLLNNIETMQDLFTQVNITDIWQFWQESGFYKKLKKMFTLSHFYRFMSVRWDVKWCTVSKITTSSLAEDRLDFDED